MQKSDNIYILNIGCWRSPNKKTRQMSPPLEFNSREKAIAKFELKKKKLAEQNYRIWHCSLISPDGEIEELC